MNELKRYIKSGRRLVDLINKLAKLEQWQSSLFMRASLNQLLKIRDKIQSTLDANTDEAEPAQQNLNQEQLEDAIEVYVGLYQAKGGQLDAWRDTLRALTRNSIGRPIYRKEAAVIKTIRERGNISQEGYVVVRVSSSDLVSLGEEFIYDRFGNELLTLKEGAVRPENIVRFVHANRLVYQFKSGKLIPIVENDKQK